MKKIILVLISFFIVLSGCQVSELESGEDVSVELSLSELQVTACTAASDAGTCDTRLAEVGIVTKEDCCTALGLCCG